MITNQIFEPDFSNHAIIVNEADVLNMLGYETKCSDPQITDSIKRQVEIGKTLMKPAALYVILKRGHSNKKAILNIEAQSFHVGNIIGEQIKKAGYIAFFMVTAGKTIEEESRRLIKKNEMLDGYVLDIVGSLIAEALADILQQEIEKLAIINHFNISNRFSPGYCNWDVSEQFKLFPLFNNNTCGIKLTDSALMDPVKSISGLIGMGKDIENRPYKCSACNDDKCIYRKIKQAEKYLFDI